MTELSNSGQDPCSGKQIVDHGFTEAIRVREVQVQGRLVTLEPFQEKVLVEAQS